MSPKFIIGVLKKFAYVCEYTIHVIENTRIPFMHSIKSGELVRLHLNIFAPFVYTENEIKFGFLCANN